MPPGVHRDTGLSGAVKPGCVHGGTRTRSGTVPIANSGATVTATALLLPRILVNFKPIVMRPGVLRSSRADGTCLLKVHLTPQHLTLLLEPPSRNLKGVLSRLLRFVLDSYLLQVLLGR